MMHCFFLATLFLASAIFSMDDQPLNQRASGEIQDASSLPLLSPDFAERKTIKMRLDNGLELLLISDPRSDNSAAALSVEAGSWNDPAEFPGMAHFCEHMLFMGTQKYPDENEFMAQVSDHGGMTNAMTTSDRTVYMFSSNPEVSLFFSTVFPIFSSILSSNLLISQGKCTP